MRDPASWNSPPPQKKIGICIILPTLADLANPKAVFTITTAYLFSGVLLMPEGPWVPKYVTIGVVEVSGLDGAPPR